MNPENPFPGRKTSYSQGEKFVQPSFSDLPKSPSTPDIPQSSDPFHVDLEAETKESKPIPDEQLEATDRGRSSTDWHQDHEDSKDRVEEELQKAFANQKR